MFLAGVSNLKQLSGKDHCALERVAVGLVAHAPSPAEGGVGSNQLTKATRAYLDCIFLVQYPLHTDDTLADYEASYQEYHDNKDVWIKNKSKRGKSTKSEKIRVNKSWNIPKQHISGHTPEHIRLKGTLDNYNTETMELLHRSHCKDPYFLTNHHTGWQMQVLRRLSRYEKIRDYSDFLEWNQEQDRLELEQAEAYQETNDIEDTEDDKDMVGGLQERAETEDTSSESAAIEFCKSFIQMKW
jgi:hypothetical protein